MPERGPGQDGLGRCTLTFAAVMEHLDPLLPEYVLGDLPRSERARWDAHLETCLPCQQLVHGSRSALAQSGPGVPAPPGALEAVLAAVAEGYPRLEPFRAPLADFLNLPLAEAEALLRTVDDAHAAWSPGPGPASWVLPVRPGPRWGEARACLIRIPPEGPIPEHGHETREHVLVLQGGYRTDDGAEAWRGDVASSEPGSRHSLRALEGPECLCAVLWEAAT